MPLEFPRARYPFYAVRPCVYVITHTPTGRHYVGATVWPRPRLAHHRALLRQGRHCAPALQEVFNRDGAGALTARVVEWVFDAAALAEREEWWTAALDARSAERGFNKRPTHASLPLEALTPAQVTVARLAHRSGRLSVDDLSRAYGVSRGRMSLALLTPWRRGALA